jgi:hypothetical protein
LKILAETLQEELRGDGLCFGEGLEVESRVRTVLLTEVATIACGTAGYGAEELGRWLVDSSPALPRPQAECMQFITTRNIERYLIRSRPMRYLGTQCRHPWLPGDCSELTAAKRTLIHRPKIVVAGMSRRLEAAMDMGGAALGVQVFAIYPGVETGGRHLAGDVARSDRKGLARSQSPFATVDLHYLLGLLNSKLLSYLFATRFAGKKLGGGYLAINKGQLARLPVRVVGARERSDLRRQRRIRKLARLAGPGCVEVDAEIDRLVFELYRVGEEEVRRVEEFFGAMRKAA